MLQPLTQYGSYMRVCQGVIDRLSLPAGTDQLALFQSAKLVGDGALAHVQDGCDITDAQLPVGESTEDADSRGISEDLEKICQILENSGIWYGIWNGFLFHVITSVNIIQEKR